MNADAEAEIKRIIAHHGTRGHAKNMMREAMEWAYRDACEIAYYRHDLGGYAIAAAIEARLK